MGAENINYDENWLNGLEENVKKIQLDYHQIYKLKKIRGHPLEFFDIL